MPKRSRSGSASSASSSSSESSIEARTPSVSTTKLSGAKGFSGKYKPPRGFDAVEFNPSDPLSESRLTGAKDQEVWALRIPAGISPSQLDGLVIKVPPQHLDAHGLREPLGSFRTPTSSPGIHNTYNLYASAPQTTASPVKGKGNKATSNADSQLIGMAATGSLNPANPRVNRSQDGDANMAVTQGAAAELESLKLLVPSGDGSQSGKMVLAPVKIAKQLHLSVASPATSGIATTEKSAENSISDTKTKRQQPWQLLTGSFKPAGTRGGPDVAGYPAPAASSSEGFGSTGEVSPKKEKNRKEKDAGEKSEKKSKRTKKA